MRLSLAFVRGLPMAALAAACLLLAAACGDEAAPTATSAPTPTVAPTVAPTATAAPTPTPSVEDYLDVVSANVVAMTSAKFGMIDETETGALFFGTTFKSMEAEVKTPSDFRMLVDVIAPGFGFVEIEMVKVGDRAFMKFSRDAPWAALPPDQVPFNFAGLAVIFAELPDTIRNPAVTGREAIQGAPTVRVEGVIESDALSDLITTSSPGHEIALTVWIDEAEFFPRQIRLEGRIYDDDGPETSRLLTIEDVNAPVDIRLPDVDAGG